MTVLTTGEFARSEGVQDWQVRRAADSLDAEIPRAGQYRLLTDDLQSQIRLEMVRRGWLTPQSEAEAANHA